MSLTRIIILLIFFIVAKNLAAQDTSKINLTNKTVFDSSSKNIKDSTSAVQKIAAIKPNHDPNKATLRSAILPGWGQAYNHEYWKIPIVYAAIGIPAGIYIYNNKWYQKTKDAYLIKLTKDTVHFSEIDPKLQNLSAESLQYYRNQFRRDRDYSVLYFLIMWGLNVVDATVFGHLKDFDVSDDLSLNIKPQYNSSTKTAGFGLVLNFKNSQHKPVSLR